MDFLKESKIGNRRVALITGASRGIGKATAEAFAQAGYDLVLTCSHSSPHLKKFGGELSDKYHISCRALQADAGDMQEVCNIFS